MLWFILACGGSPAEHAEHAPKHGEHVEDHAAHGAHGEGHGHPNAEHAHHRFDDPEKWAKVFDDPERDSWQKPAWVVEQLGVRPGMTVADIGAGTGYFNPHLAAGVGEDGAVIAVDIEPKLVAYMTERAERDGTPQVEARVTEPDSTGLQPAEVDRVLLVDVYHHITDREAYFGSLKGALKPGGELGIVDLTREAPFGPPVEERLTAEQVQSELEAAGWTLSRAIEGLPHQYFLVFTPAS